MKTQTLEKETNGLVEKRRYTCKNLLLVESPFGKVVVFKIKSTTPPTTIVPGIYNQELEPKYGKEHGRRLEQGLMRIEVTLIPKEDKEKRQKISNILREKGYTGAISFWRE